MKKLTVTSFAKEKDARTLGTLTLSTFVTVDQCGSRSKPNRGGTR